MKAIRLYKYFKPKIYDLSFDLNPKNLSFSGQVSIKGCLRDNQKKLRLHSKDLNIISCKINDQICQFSIVKDLDELNIELPNFDKQITIDIVFEAKITNPMHGIYPCFGRHKEVILATQFESHHAREAFPCIDEPEAKAIFNLTLTTNKADNVLANTNPKKIITNKDTQTIVFESTPLMSTYLLAFVAGRLSYKETKTNNGVIVKAWATKDQIDNIDFALEVGKKSIEFFNDYFEIDYPLPKCDLVALPDFAAGAMENWGLITFRETCMLVDPKNTSLDAKQYVAMVVAHEVAHQWFGNLVTMNWWNDLWLNEGFASWIEFLAVDDMFPDWHMWTQFTVLEQEVALSLDSLENTHPIEVDIPHPDEIRTIFDSISYNKGASVIHMLHSYLGKKDFRSGVKHYLNKFAYSTATTLDLWQALEESSNKPVSKFMSAWTKQSGFPLVTLEKASKNSIILNQSRFYLNDLNKPSKYLWPVPIACDSIKTEIFDTKEIVINTSKELSEIKINQGQTGFYITRYPTQMYLKLGELVKSKNLPEIDRLGLISDTFDLARSGNVGITEFMDLLINYSDESSAPIWDSISSSLANIRRILLGAKFIESIKPFIRYLTDQNVRRLSWDESYKDSYYDKMLRPVALSLASSADNKDIVDKAKLLFDKVDIISDLPSNLRNMILMSVSRRGNHLEFNKIFKMLGNATAPEDRVILTQALCNFRGQEEIVRAINIIRSKDVKLQDVGYCLAYIFTNPKAKEIAWVWLKDNWQWIKENLGSDMVYSRIPVYVARGCNDKKFLIDYQQFFSKVTEPSLERGIDQGEEIIIAQDKWCNRDQKILLNWLDKHVLDFN